MTKLLQQQMYRLNRYKPFAVLLIIAAVAPAVTVAFWEALMSVYESLTGSFVGDLFDGEITYSVLTGIANTGSISDLLAIICSALFLREEFSSGTIRNALISGKSRTATYFAYFFVSLIIGAIFKMAQFAVGVTACSAACGFGDVSFFTILTSCFITLVMGLITMCFAQSCVCMFVFVTKKTAPAVLLPLLVTYLLPSAITTIVTLLSELGMVDISTLSWIPLFNMTLFDASVIDGVLVAKITMYVLPLSALLIYLGHAYFRKADIR